jgi:hypothetical protein
MELTLEQTLFRVSERNDPKTFFNSKAVAILGNLFACVYVKDPSKMGEDVVIRRYVSTG